MQRLMRYVIVFLIVGQELVFRSGLDATVLAQAIDPVSTRLAPLMLPFYPIPRNVSPFEARSFADRQQVPWLASKLRFFPIRIWNSVVPEPTVSKAFPPAPRLAAQDRYSPSETTSRTTIGLVLDVESAYGSGRTFISRLQHGTQFKGAYYSLNAHWETTDSLSGDNPEGTLSTHLKIDWDLSKTAKVFLESTYLQSHIALPQLPGDAEHEKSALETLASYQVNWGPEVTILGDFSWEHAQFTDHSDVRYTLNNYGTQLTGKYLWGNRNLLSLHVQAAWEEFSEENVEFDDRYYGSATLINSLALHERLSLDAGLRTDYYHAEQGDYTDHLLAPVITTRLQLFPKTSLYTTYHPRIDVPRFTDLYIRQFYTLVNPNIHPGKASQWIESGIKQRFGDAFAVNVNLFYQDVQNGLFQIDANADHLLEYEQIPSVDLLGVRANLQLNYHEQFVQDITYTYTKHHIFSEQHFEDPGEEFRNQILTYLPNHQVQTSLYWNAPFGLSVKLSGVYVSEQYRNRLLEAGLIGKRFFVNAELSQRITKRVQLFLIGRNLTDTNTYDIIPLLNSEEITSARLFAGGIRIRF